MKDRKIKALLKKYSEGTLTPEEKGLLESWYIHQAGNSQDTLSDQEVNESLKRIEARLPLLRRRRISWNSRWPKIAAAILLLVSAGLFMYIKKAPVKQAINTTYKHDIEPGGNKAFLTLADGKRISLTDIPNGTLAEQAGLQITKTTDGQLAYRISAPNIETATRQYNTIETPKGGQYQIQLPDGSKVWLNAASSLRFPVNLSSGEERRVELSGEAYFEVAKDKARPFIVTTDQQSVKVLGTHFNISSYPNDAATKTTLLEGRVKVSATQKRSSEVLKPGQQSSLVAGSMTVEQIDTELAVAWKNNQFMFESESIENIMKRIERWYDVKVEYLGEIPDDKFGGAVSRFDNVSKVLSILELTGSVRFKIEGRTIYVSK